MKVEDVMCRSAHVCSPEESLASAARVMWENDCGCAPVIDERGKVVGMVTDRDVCMCAYFSRKPLVDLTVRDAMSNRVVRCSPDDTIEAVETAMSAAQVRRLPVTTGNGALVGVISLNDIARAAEHETLRRTPHVPLNDVALTLIAVSRPRNGTDAAV